MGQLHFFFLGVFLELLVLLLVAILKDDPFPGTHVWLYGGGSGTREGGGDTGEVWRRLRS